MEKKNTPKKVYGMGIVQPANLVDIKSEEFKEAVLKVVNTALQENTRLREVIKKHA